MVNFPPTIPVGSSARTVETSRNTRIVPSSAADKRETRAIDRRRMYDRRARRSARQIMDRRSGPERRRASIDLSV